MRQKVAKALRREAERYALQTGRTTEIYKTLARKVTRTYFDRFFRKQTDEIVATQDILSDGPRFFYLNLKKAFRLGLLKR